MKIKEIAFFGYPVSDVARARAFYQDVLGLKLLYAHEMPDDKWWIEYDIAGSALAISNTWSPSGKPGPGVALEVDDLDASLAEMKKAGVPVCHDVMSSPVCRFVTIADPDGNAIVLHQTTSQ